MLAAINSFEIQVQLRGGFQNSQASLPATSIATLQALMGHRKNGMILKHIHLARTNLRKEMVKTAL